MTRSKLDKLESGDDLGGDHGRVDYFSASHLRGRPRSGPTRHNTNCIFKSLDTPDWSTSMRRIVTALRKYTCLPNEVPAHATRFPVQ